MLIPRCRLAAASLGFSPRSLTILQTIIKKFPITDNGKIAWWLKNKDMLKGKYAPPESEGSFTVALWLFGEGYKEEGKYDRRCFEDMKTQKNRIDKNSLILVKKSKNSGMYFILDSGTYRTNDAPENLLFSPPCSSHTAAVRVILRTSQRPTAQGI